MQENELVKYKKQATINKDRILSFNKGSGIKQYKILLYLETVYKSLAKYKGLTEKKDEAINNLLCKIDEYHSSILKTVNEKEQVSYLQLTKGFVVTCMSCSIKKNLLLLLLIELLNIVVLWIIY